MNRGLLSVSVAVAVLFVAHTAGHSKSSGTSRAEKPTHPTARTTSAPASCSARFSSLAPAIAAMRSATTGATECLTSGTYGAVSLTMKKSADAALAAAPNAHVAVGAVNLNGTHIGIRGLWVKGEIDIQAGSSFITVSRNDITGGYFGIVFDTSDCTAPNAPTWPDCQPQPKITDVAIVANHFHGIGQASGGEDAIHLDNWARVRIVSNEFDHIIEAGNHTDCLQSVYGGDRLTFENNYEHDNNCQGFFVKDGDATNVTLRDNLFVRDSIGSYANFSQIWDSETAIVRNNTIWDGKGLALVADGSVVTPTAEVDHNLLYEASLNNTSGTHYALTNKAYNIFGDPGVEFPKSSTDQTVASPRFVSPATGDYRLARNPHGIGIDWRPADQHYGPTRCIRCSRPSIRSARSRRVRANQADVQGR